MNKRGRSVLGLFLFGILIFSIIVSCVNFVSAVNSPKDFFTDIYNNWQNADFQGTNQSIAKIIFAFLIVFLVFSILDTTGFIKNKGIILIISVLVSFLATMYITSDEVYAILISYTALGLTLASIIPFLILAGFTYTAIKEANPTMLIFQKIAWGGFALFMAYKVIFFFFSDEITTTSFSVVIILLIMTGASLALFVGNKSIRRFLAKNYIESLEESEREKILKSIGFIKATGLGADELTRSST